MRRRVPRDSKCDRSARRLVSWPTLSDFPKTERQPDLLGGLPTAARHRPVLQLPNGEARSVTDPITLGSAPDVDVTIDDPMVSRLHCELQPRDDGLWVRDLGSRNGTFVSGLLVREARLGERSELRLGGSSCIVTYESEPTQIKLWPVERFGALVGKSVAMRELFARLDRVCESSATVLIQGETGTGKELVARSVHEMSKRHEGPFVVVDCGALHESLIEAELFGHTKGAFTGASGERVGALAAADGGTVFLDEVGELPLSVQPKFLRFLERRTVRRLGEHAPRSVDVRVVSATHRDLREMVNRGGFREDLFFRLSVLPVQIPPLRERPEDISILVEHFLPDASQPLPPELLAELNARAWEGNVRELRNFVERALALGAAEALAMASTEDAEVAFRNLPNVPLDVPFKILKDRWNDHLEREYLRGMLERHEGNVSAVSAAAGIARSYVHRLIRKHRL